GLITFSPLAQGLLTNRYLNGIPQDSRIVTDGRFLKAERLTPALLSQLQALNTLAAARGQTLAQMALCWVMKDSDVTSVLVGASRKEQILDNLGIVNAAPLSAEELAEIDRITACNA
ncbi:MAG: aldo/keto reductase, partial [Candidatus Fimenecus sp.]